MSKLSRNVLKEIVKECILEIFEESFFAQGSLVSENKNRSQSPRKKKRPYTRGNDNKSRHLDNITYNQNDTGTSVNRGFDNKINNITSRLTSDPVMADIFKDTASTTLQEQNTSGGRTGLIRSSGDPASLKVSNSDPTELFGESASKWATLAFADSIKR